MRPRRSSSTQTEEMQDESQRVRWGVAFWIALGVLILMVLIAIMADWVTPYDPLRPGSRRELSGSERRSLARHGPTRP